MLFDDLRTFVTGAIEISRTLLWDVDLSQFDYHRSRSFVVQRIIERGTPEDYYAAFELYGGIEEFRKILKDKVSFLSPRNMSFVCHTFDLKKEELKCYKQQQAREQYLNSPPTERELEILRQLSSTQKPCLEKGSYLASAEV